MWPFRRERGLLGLNVASVSLDSNYESHHLTAPLSGRMDGSTSRIRSRVGTTDVTQFESDGSSHMSMMVNVADG